jgi:hypothetical protein
MDAGSGGLQSGFVLAAIIAGVLFVDRLGGADGLARRVYQVGLGVTIAFVAISATTAFLRQPDLPEGLDSSSSFSSSDSSGSAKEKAQESFFRDVANRNSEATTIHAGVGLLVLVGALASLRRWPTVALGGAVGGLLLILFGGVHGSSDSTSPLGAIFGSYASIFGAAYGSSRTVDTVHFAVLLSGGLALFAFGLNRWESPSPPPAVTAPEA